MAGRSTHPPPTAPSLARDVFSQIGKGAQVGGQLTGEGLLLVLGRLAGTVVLRGDLVVGKGGWIEGDKVEAARLLVQGTVRGSIHIQGPAEVGQEGVLEGDLRAERFEAAGAARLEVRLDIGPPTGR